MFRVMQCIMVVTVNYHKNVTRMPYVIKGVLGFVSVKSIRVMLKIRIKMVSCIYRNPLLTILFD